MKLKFKYLLNDPRNGKDRYYVRRSGHPKIRINAPVGTSAFMMEYNAAVLRVTQAKSKVQSKFTAGMLGWLFSEYMNSPEFIALNKATIKERSNVYARIGRAYGNLYVHSITPIDIYALRDAQSKTPAMANKFVKCLRYAFKWGIKRTITDNNPAENVELLSYKVKGFPALTEEDAKNFLDFHGVGTKPHLAFMIAATINGRRGDIVKIGPRHIHSDRLIYTQEKNKEKNPYRIDVEFSPFLMRAIDAVETGDFTFLINGHGKPYSKEGFGNQFKKWMEAAGIHGKNTHGIRKAFASWAAEAGATDEELMAGYGWRARSQVSTYTKAAKTATLSNSITDKTHEKLSHLSGGETKSNIQVVDIKQQK